MTVKSVRGRRRYTAFEVPQDAGRHDAEKAVSNVPSAKVITCRDGFAVIRSLPSERGILEDGMAEGLPGSRTFDCSGTLRALRTRHPQLNAPRKRRKRRRASRTRLPKRFILPPLSRRVRD
ncbi:MAG: hypothetical protein Q4Q62_08295 [Thermoplasmata archaeon]|nr:hypothetical protein [Thermoplasmata archaeon]